MNLSGVILAGGESSRMGTDKAWLQIDGSSLLARALSIVRDAGITEIFISGRPRTDYSNFDYPVLLDRKPGCGPLSGIERALEEANAPVVLVLAVDLPKMSADFLRKLAGASNPRTGAIPRFRDQWEPLAAIYPKRCRFIARDCLVKGQRAARDFAVACLREKAINPLPVPPAYSACFENWNTPSDVSHNPITKP